MRWQLVLGCLAALSLTAAGARAQEYTIKLKHSADLNKNTTVKDNSKETTAFKVSDAGGKVLKEDKTTVVTDETYTETVLEKGDRSAKKFKRSYETATRTLGDKKETLPYQGRTVVFERKDGKCTATVEGTPALDPKLLDALARRASGDSADFDAAILPQKPVKVGDKWPVDIKTLARGFANEGGPEIDADKSKGDVTFTKAYKKDGTQFAVLDVALKLAVPGLGGLKFDTPSTMDLKATLDLAIDGSSTAGTETSGGKIEGKGVQTQGGQKLTIEVSVDTSGKKEVSAEK